VQTRFSPVQLTDAGTAASERAIRKCVRCGFCLPTCPTYALGMDERDSPRGRIYIMKDMLEARRAPTAAMVGPIDRCLSCLACRTACPSGVDYMQLVDHARTYIEKTYRRPWPERALRWALAMVLPYPERFRRALALGRTFGFLQSLGGRLGALLDLAGRPDAADPEGAAPVEAPPKVIVLKGCAEPVLRPQIRAAAVRVLARCGMGAIEAPAEGCCGSLVHHLGREDEAKGFARRNIDAWSGALDGAEAIVACASGCGTHLKTYGTLLADDPAYAARAARVSALARDVSEVIDAAALPRTEPKGVIVAYQSACSLQHGQGVRAAPRRILEAAGFTVREPAGAHLCCGSAGTYNILQPAIAGQLREAKLAALAALGADVVASGNIGCLTQLTVPGGPPMVHTVELIDWALGGDKPAGLA